MGRFHYIEYSIFSFWLGGGALSYSRSIPVESHIHRNAFWSHSSNFVTAAE